MKAHKGFSNVAVFGVLVIVATVIGLSGWRIYSSHNNESSGNVVQTSQEASIQTTQDIVNAEQELEQLNIDDELDSSVLDDDINDLQ